MDLLAVAAALIAFIQAGVPAGPENEDYIISAVSVRAEHCNLALAKKVDLLALAKEPQKWSGQCVAVNGYWQGNVLFAAVRDSYRRYAASNRALIGRRVGIYGTEELLASAPRSPVGHTVVGLVGNCEALHEGAIMVMGYCHYTDGPYVAVAEVHRR